jgi:putative transposase
MPCPYHGYGRKKVTRTPEAVSLESNCSAIALCARDRPASSVTIGAMPYARLSYHVVWATKERLPLIDADIARVAEIAIRAACRDVEAQVFAIGFMPDHVHLAVAIPPKHAVAMVIGRIKGASSHAINLARRDHPEPFAWQSEYGALTFGPRALPEVVAYVNDQPRRHAAGPLLAGLERWTDPE